MKLRPACSIRALDPHLHQCIWLHLSALLGYDPYFWLQGKSEHPKETHKGPGKNMQTNWSRALLAKTVTACCAEGYYSSFFSPKDCMATISHSNRHVYTHDHCQVHIMYICSFNPDLSGSLSIQSPYTMWLTLAQKSWPTLPARCSYTTWKNTVMNTIWVAKRYIKHPGALWP